MRTTVVSVLLLFLSALSFAFAQSCANLTSSDGYRFNLSALESRG
jgi:hypothetical protein